jgi:hypothetical protein
MISRKDVEQLIAYLEQAAHNGEGADLSQDLAEQLLEVLNAAGAAKPARKSTKTDEEIAPTYGAEQ